jgi:hypothetical protein
VTYEWVRNTFDELIVQDNLPKDGLLHDLLTSAISDIDWYSIAEDVIEYINENYKQ